MGALLHKPSQSTYRSWELTSVNTNDYIEFAEDTRITVLTYAGRAVRILSSFSWLSDRVRYSCSGFYRQRLTECFYLGSKTTWTNVLSVLTEYSIDSRAVLHWSALEPSCIADVYNLFRAISDDIALPYSDYSSSLFLRAGSPGVLNNYCYKFNLKNLAPNLEFSLASFGRLSRTSEAAAPLDIPTSIKETEKTFFEGGHSFFDQTDKSFSVLVQTEAVTSIAAKSVYFGSHGYVNASRASLVVPLLMPYERTNSATGTAFIRGPLNAKSPHEISTILIQLYSLAVGNWSYRRPESFNYGFLTTKVIKREVFLYESSCRSLYNRGWFSRLNFSNLQPELIISDIQWLIK